MNLIFVKIKDDDGDSDILNVQEIVGIEPNHGSTGGWLITMKNSIEYIVCDAVVSRICGAIKRFGEIVDCTNKKDRDAEIYDGNPRKKKADSPRHITFD